MIAAVDGMPRPGEKWRARIAALVASLLGASWLLSALVRRLNFDESLALKSGWLLLSDHAGQPTFLMPTTLLMGATGHLVDSPGSVLTLLRLLVVISLGTALVWAGSRGRSPLETSVVIGLTLLQQTFVVHGLEFRYDWGILLGLLVCYGACLSAAGPRFGLIGACVSWLAMHHLKGVYFATCLLLASAVYAVVFRRRSWRHDLGRLALGAAGLTAIWLALVAALGLRGRLWLTYSEFVELSRATEPASLWQSLEKAIQRDAGWWLFSLAVTALALFAGVRQLRAAGALSGQLDLPRIVQQLNGPAVLAAAFAASTLVFLTLHPHPWPYMLALSAPFVAASIATPLTSWLQRGQFWRLAGVVLLAVGGQLAGEQPGPIDCYVQSLQSDRAELVAALDELHRRVQPGDTIVDPAGLAYFVPPCEQQWYVDTLFRSLVRKGSWMASFTPASLQSCRFMLATYRLAWLPRATFEATLHEYRACQSKGLWVRADAAGAIGCNRVANLKDDLLASYW